MEEEAKQNEVVNLTEILRTLIINQQALAEAIGIQLPAIPTLPSEANTSIKKGQHVILPESLESLMQCPRAFRKAVKRGLIRQNEDGKLVWTNSNRTLLAYLLGRLFCGDSSKSICAGTRFVWMQGNLHFPDEELTLLFGYSVRKNRTNRNMMNLPKNFQLIDNLFVK